MWRCKLGARPADIGTKMPLLLNGYTLAGGDFRQKASDNELERSDDESADLQLKDDPRQARYRRTD